MTGRLPVSLRALLVFVIVTALSIGGFFLVRNSVDRQNVALLQGDAAQVELLLQASAQSLQTQLRTIAVLTVNAGSTPQAFAAQTKTVTAVPGASVALVDTTGPAPRITLATGPDLHTGAVPAALAGFVAGGGTGMSSAVVRAGSRTLLALESASTVYPRVLAVETSLLHPGTVTPNRSKAYSHIYVDLYASTRPDPSQLIITTYGSRPLPSPVASALLRFGSLHWLVQASQKEPLAGAYAQNTPWIALGVGLIVAVVLALIVEILARRHRHAERLVAERTEALLEAQKDLLRNERLAALGEFAAVVGHELRNPLAAAINELYLYTMGKEDSIDADSRVHLERAEGQIYRAAKLSEDLTAYTRDREPRLGDVDFSDLVRGVLDATPPPEGVEVDLEESTHFVADASLMAQVVTNLVTNAYQAMPGGGRVGLKAESNDDTTRITVEDTGTGVDPALEHRIFDPFVSSKDDGTGLGLAIVQRLVTLHDGAVSIHNTDAGGARVVIDLPRRTPA
ncbi:MAG TPA: HAMP domain-containing sensor histidine kinase [Acidimicrobiales bacterium]|nr:HAMP domain-containing sensor histidine kinase [Acidimicrobiales bacterium]